MAQRYKYVDTRQYIRLPSSHLIKYKIVKGKQSKNISLSDAKDRHIGGVSFITNEKLLPFSLVELEIGSPTNPNPIKATAQVLTAESVAAVAAAYKITAEFIDIKEKDRKNLGLIEDGQIIALSPSDFSIKYRSLKNKDVGIFVTSTTKDISAGGVAFIAKERLSVSGLIELEINFPAVERPIKTVAKVVRIEPVKGYNIYKVGAQFVHIEENDKKSIDEYVNMTIVAGRKRKWWWRTLG